MGRLYSCSFGLAEEVAGMAYSQCHLWIDIPGIGDNIGTMDLWIDSKEATTLTNWFWG